MLGVNTAPCIRPEKGATLAAENTYRVNAVLAKSAIFGGDKGGNHSAGWSKP
ncbi:hypothetical protein KCP73_14440 [Salmonella enterica subsp. enterica]|nr:hypothetical protein KCP73_14440 [Salmonella enterica subsp. enterica]